VVSPAPNWLVQVSRIGVPSGTPASTPPSSAAPVPELLDVAPPVDPELPMEPELPVEVEPDEVAWPPLPPVPPVPAVPAVPLDDDAPVTCVTEEEHAPSASAPRKTAEEKASRDSMSTPRLRLDDSLVKAWKNP
jgi:hypothetical protein